MARDSKWSRRAEVEKINEKYVRSFDFTPFQLKVVELVYNMRAVRTEQIARILNYNSNYVRTELKDLYYNWFLDRRRPYEEKVANDNKGTVQGVYMLDEAGKILISGMLDIDLGEVKWKQIENLIKYEKLKHILECSEIVARVFEECRNAKCKVEEYKCDKFLWTQFDYMKKSYEFCPDIYFKILNKDKNYRFFVENDEATMDIRSFLTKIPKYDNFALSKEYLNKYDDYPRVLVITTSRERARILAEEVAKKQKTKIEFLFTWHDAFYEKPFGTTTFIHTSVKKYPKTYSMFDEIPEEYKVGLREEEKPKEETE